MPKLVLIIIQSKDDVQTDEGRCGNEELIGIAENELLERGQDSTMGKDRNISQAGAINIPK